MLKPSVCAPGPSGPDLQVARVRYVPALDGVRGIAILAVLLYHSGRLPGGWLGVDVFFVLSGFLITAILMQERLATGHIKFSHFYLRRGLRLLPLVVVVTVLTTIATPFFAPAPWDRSDWGSAALVLLYVGNLAMIAGRDIGLLGHTWSLAMEEQFYLLWPATLAALARLRRGFAATLVVGLIAAVIGFRTFLVHQPAVSPDQLTSLRRLTLSLDTRGEPIAMGALLGLLFAWGLLTLPPRLTSRLGTLSALLLGGLFIAASWPRGYLYGATASAGLATSLLIMAALVPGRLARALSWAPLVGTGRISYGLYLWHFGIFHLCGAMVSPSDPAAPPLRAALAWLICFAVSLLSYRWLESPFLRLKGRFHSA